MAPRTLLALLTLLGVSLSTGCCFLGLCKCTIGANWSSSNGGGVQVSCGGGSTASFLEGLSPWRGAVLPVLLPRPTASAAVNENTYTGFRFKSISIREPHIFANESGLCVDVTGLINEQINARLTQDQDHDGSIDAGGILIFQDFSPSGPGGRFELVSANCDTLSPTTCIPDTISAEIDVLYSYFNNNANPCLAPVPAYLHPYTPPVTSPSQPCFATSQFDLGVVFGSARFPMLATRIAGSYSGNPPTQITNGLMQGFLPEAAADTARLPAAVPLVGGQLLSSILPGGNGCCSPSDDRDVGPDGVTRGWWFYANFTAEKIKLSSPVLAVPLEVDKQQLKLSAHPNPFGLRVALTYELSSSGPVSLQVLDPRGRLVATVFEGTQPAGAYRTMWDGRDASGHSAPAGVYFARVRTLTGANSKPIVLVR